MVGALGEGSWSKQLDKAVLTTGWDRIYRATATERMFDEAMKIEGLDPEVLQSIVDLYGSYRTEVSSINDRLKNLAKSEEPASIVREGERFVSMVSQGVSGMARNMGRGFGGAGGETADDPMRKAFDERSAVGERYQERLKALLTPEQWEALPKGRTQGGGGGGFGTAAGMQRMLERIPEDQRKQLMDRVDTNKNGTIDEDEMNGVREYMREQFQNMGGGGGGGGGGQGGQGGRGGRGQGGGQGGGGGSPQI
jgi:hypothetical protein